jgi:hypothetical protein
MFSRAEAFSHFGSIFFFVDSLADFLILDIDMARIFDHPRKSTLALRQRKRFLLQQLDVPPDLLRASFVESFAACGKAQCQCHHGGARHGPFYYLSQCLAVGKMNKFLLKTQEQQNAARQGVEHFRALQEQIEELSQLNAELLRRQERLSPE